MPTDRYSYQPMDRVEHPDTATAATAGKPVAPPAGTLAEEAEWDRAAGRPTVGTRGWADYEAFENR